MSQIARGSHKAAVTGGQIPEPYGIGSRELLARRLRLIDQNTSPAVKRVTKKPNCTK